MYLKILFGVLSLINLTIVHAEPGCLIDITLLRSPSPIVLAAYTNKFLYPPTPHPPPYNYSIVLPRGTSITIGCPENGRLNLPSSPQTIFATCNTNDNLVTSNGTIKFFDLVCDRNYSGSAKPRGQSCALGQTEFIDVGFDLGNNVFASIVTVCFDHLVQEALYANFTLTPAIVNLWGPQLPSGIEDRQFYNLTTSIANLYDHEQVLKTIGDLRGCDAYSEGCVRNSLELDSLVEDYEVFYAVQKIAVNRYLLGRPQWQVCLVSQYMNSRVLDLLHILNRDLEIYTGSLGISTLAHSVSGNPLDVYLDPSHKAIAVAPLKWRLVYEPISKKAVVLASIDNAELLGLQEFVYCEDITHSLSWMDWVGNCGISYACSYQDFKKKVGGLLPDLNVTGVLL